MTAPVERLPGGIDPARAAKKETPRHQGHQGDKQTSCTDYVCIVGQKQPIKPESGCTL